MANLAPIFNSFLTRHAAPPIRKLPPKNPDSSDLDSFLREAYRIHSHIASLHTQLRSIRQSYLSTAPPRRNLLRNNAPSRQQQQQQQLTDREREDIDANAKLSRDQLDLSIRVLSEAEDVRHARELETLRKKYGRGLGVLGAWAAGGITGTGASKSKEYIEAEERTKMLNLHREGVVWLLRKRLNACVSLHKHMMEVRLNREMEKSRSVLAKMPLNKGLATGMGEDDISVLGGGGDQARKSYTTKPLPPQNQTNLPAELDPRTSNPTDLSPEQIQLFEQDNHDMLRHYETTLDQIHTVEKSLIEISQLHSQLADNLDVQAAHIDQIMANSLRTGENVDSGNQQLKKATQRPSTAKYTFYATCGLCTFLIVWDLVF